MRRDYQAVVFDMDGVIFDSERVALECWIQVAEKYGIRNMESTFITCIGTTKVKTREIMLHVYGDDFPFDQIAKEASIMYHTKCDGGKLPIKIGVVEIFNFLEEKNMKIALASSSRKQTVINELRDANLLKNFDVIISGDMVSKSKPDPEIFLLACEKLNVLPQDAYAIEDSYNGIRSAFSGKLNPIMVPDLLPANEEMQEKTVSICNSLLDVIEYLS